MDKYTQYALVVIVIAVVALLSVNTKQPSTVKGDLPNDDYLKSTSDIDFGGNIVLVASELKKSSTNTEDLIKKTISYTKNHVAYTGGITQSQCINDKASEVLERGTGDCVSMSRLNVALLRANGIPSRTVGGCLLRTKSCTLTFALIPGQDLIPSSNIIDNQKRALQNNLHEWAEAYDGNKWISIESTTGNIFTPGCDRYNLFSYDNTATERCVITDFAYVQSCNSQ